MHLDPAVWGKTGELRGELRGHSAFRGSAAWTLQFGVAAAVVGFPMSAVGEDNHLVEFDALLVTRFGPAHFGMNSATGIERFRFSESVNCAVSSIDRMVGGGYPAGSVVMGSE